MMKSFFRGLVFSLLCFQVVGYACTLGQSCKLQSGVIYTSLPAAPFEFRCNIHTDNPFGSAKLIVDKPYVLYVNGEARPNYYNLYDAFKAEHFALKTSSDVTNAPTFTIENKGGFPGVGNTTVRCVEAEHGHH